MADIDLIFDREDERSLVDYILAQGGWLVPDLRYLSPDYRDVVEINDLDHFGEVRQDARLFFILFEEYVECPLSLQDIPSGCFAGKYYIQQRVGGPTIDFLACNVHTQNGVETVSQGFLGRYPTYKNTITGEYERVPAELIKRYRQIVAFAKKGSTIVKSGCGRKYYIGPHTYRALKEGTLHLGEGLEVP